MREEAKDEGWGEWTREGAIGGGGGEWKRFGHRVRNTTNSNSNRTATLRLEWKY